MAAADYGDYFFHYTTRDAAFGHILPTRKLRMSPYSAMRDPLENKKWLFPGSYSVPDDIPDGHPEHPETAGQEFGAAANEIRDSAKLLSLTIDAEDLRGRAELFGRGWARARMWEQYAENHAGVCLRFKREDLTARITESLNTQGLASPYHRPVGYTDEGSGGGLPLNLNEIVGKVDGEFVRQFVQQHHIRLFFRKTIDWESEHEYRFVVTTPDMEYVYVDFGDALDVVAVGENCPRWQWPAVVEACQGLNAEPVRVEWSTGAPRAWRLRPAEAPAHS